MSTLAIDLYSDIVCPWCFIGTRRLESVMASFAGLNGTVRHHPYLLHPDAPPEGIDLREMLSQKYGGDPERMFEHVEGAARADGIPLDFAPGFRTYSTLAAHTLLRHAGAKGTQRELVDALFVAYFVEARNISDAAVLIDAATKYGFAADEASRLLQDPDEIAITRRDVREASELGIRGVPLFILNGRYAVSGAQPAAIFRQAITKALALEGS
jgi:predicted DsbA family dithiol-disulfide isomerase